MIEILVLLFLAIIALGAWRLKKESIALKNIQIAFAIVLGLATAHYAYREFIQKKEDREKRPPVLNVNCKLEKVGEEDSCYWLKATVHYENKSERRIYIILSTIQINGFDVTAPAEKLNIDSVAEIIKKDGWYAKDYTYYTNNKILYSRTLGTGDWYDFNQETGGEFIIKVQKEYEAASMVVDVTLGNEEITNMQGYSFKTLFRKNGVIYSDIKSSKNGISVSDSTISKDLLREYGVCHTYAVSQVYLKEPVKK